MVIRCDQVAGSNHWSLNLHEKTNNLGFQLGTTQISLNGNRKLKLEILDLAKTKPPDLHLWFCIMQIVGFLVWRLIDTIHALFTFRRYTNT